MALRFKEYRENLKAKQEQERQAEFEQKAEFENRQNYIDSLKKGQKIKYSNCVNAFTGRDFIQIAYVIESTGNCVWVADNKQDAIDGYGYTISFSSIII